MAVFRDVHTDVFTEPQREHIELYSTARRLTRTQALGALLVSLSAADVSDIANHG